jgi:2-phospho-L-lactate/phosphoenolpyruvate guanylyltransferase
MKVNALIPVKSLMYAKSRLANTYSLYEREKLVFFMLNHVLSILKSCRDIKQITVVTPDESVRKYLSKIGVHTLPEEKHGLNPALTKAAQKENEDVGLLTIFADLPFLTQDDVEYMIKQLEKNDVVLAASKDNGTNAILVKKPLLLPYLFGINSFEAYYTESEKRNVKTAVYHSKTIAFDIDTIEDITIFEKLQSSQMVSK